MTADQRYCSLPNDGSVATVRSVFYLILVGALVLVSRHGFAQSESLVPVGANEIKIPNPSLENDGRGWRIWCLAYRDRGTWPQEAHSGKVSALIETSVERQRCVLVSPGLPQLQPGMKVRISFYAKWCEGDNAVFIGFQVPPDTNRAAWLSLWQGDIPKDGVWHRIDAEVRVPVFLANEAALELRIGLPYERQSMWRKPYTDFEKCKYLLDDVSVIVLSGPKPVQPQAAVKHSFDPNDPRDDSSRFGVYWTPWKAYSRTSLTTPLEGDRSRQEIGQELDAMQQLGVKWIRSIWRWDKIEWNQGKPNYAFLDYVVEEAWKRGLRFVPCLNTSPRWASTAPEGHAEYHSYPPKMADWGNFVYETINHFKPRIKYWETWNEPNGLYWLGSVEAFCELQKTAYRSAKRADPQCRILLGAFSGSGLGYMDQLLRQGAKDYFDLVSVHPYSGKMENLNNAAFGTRSIRLLLAEYGCEDRPIWFTEIGWPTDMVPDMSTSRRAELLMELYSYPFPESVEKIFWFPFDTWGRPPPKGPGGLVDTYGDKQERTPAFEAYRKVIEKASQMKAGSP